MTPVALSILTFVSCDACLSYPNQMIHYLDGRRSIGRPNQREEPSYFIKIMSLRSNEGSSTTYIRGLPSFFVNLIRLN